MPAKAMSYESYQAKTSADWNTDGRFHPFHVPAAENDSTWKIAWPKRTCRLPESCSCWTASS